MKLVIINQPGDGYSGTDTYCFEYESIEKLQNDLKQMAIKYVEDYDEIANIIHEIYLNEPDDTEAMDREIFEKTIRPYAIFNGLSYLSAKDFVGIRWNGVTNSTTYEYSIPEIYTVDEWFAKKLADTFEPGYNSDHNGVLH